MLATPKELNRGCETRNEEDDEEIELEEKEPCQTGTRQTGHPQGQRVVGAATHLGQDPIGVIVEALGQRRPQDGADPKDIIGAQRPAGLDRRS